MMTNSQTISIASNRRGDFAARRCLACSALKTLTEFRRYNFTLGNRGAAAPLVCGSCRAIYDAAERQLARCGNRRRLVKRTDIPRLTFKNFARPARAVIARRKQIFKILTWFRDEKIQGNREVKWMTDELTKKILNLPNRAAVVVGKTYDVRGEDFEIDDYEAITRIRNGLDEIEQEDFSENRIRSLLEDSEADDEMTRKILRLSGKMREIIDRTSEILGDGFEIDDYEAITRIRDMLQEIDPRIIERNKNKRLSHSGKL